MINPYSALPVSTTAHGTSRRVISWATSANGVSGATVTGVDMMRSSTALYTGAVAGWLNSRVVCSARKRAPPADRNAGSTRSPGNRATTESVSATARGPTGCSVSSAEKPNTSPEVSASSAG